MMQLANIRKVYDSEKNENNSTMKACLSSEDTTLLLHAAPRAYKTQINDILLTALMLAYGDLTGEYTLYFDLEGHGREHITEGLDLSQTVGWFTSVFPVFLTLENVDDLSTVIKYVKEQLRKIPAHGIGFGILRFLSKEKNNFDSIREPDIIFNYLGQLDNTVIKGRLLRNAVESYGSCSHPKNKHSYSLEISAQIKNGIFEISWTCVDTYDPKILEALASQYIDRLKSLILHCTDMDNFGYVPSDFPLAKLNQQTLDKVFGRVKKIEDIYPLSPLQAGLLFTALADIQSDAYLVQTLYTFKGNIDPEILKLACQTINEHYSAFRTGFVWEGLDS